MLRHLYVAAFLASAATAAAQTPIPNSKIVIGKKTIVTPSARELGNEHGVFVIAGG